MVSQFEIKGLEDVAQNHRLFGAMRLKRRKSRQRGIKCSPRHISTKGKKAVPFFPIVRVALRRIEVMCSIVIFQPIYKALSLFLFP